MQSKWIKQPLMFAAVLAASISTANANQYPTSTESQSMGAPTAPQHSPARQITPNAGPRVANGADVFITADFIWWKAVQDGTQYGMNGLKTNATPATAYDSVGKGKAKQVAEAWAPGFKVGLGLNLSHDGWDLYAEYTWLRPDNSNSISGNVVGQTLGAGGQTGPFADVDKASARWDLDFNVIDIELGRNFYLSQFLTMRPFIGLKGTWQDQSVKLRYEATDFELAPQIIGQGVPVTGPYRSRWHTDTWGLGVRGGFNIAWYMSKSWSFYGDLAFSAVWANYHNVSRKDRLDDSITNTSTTLINTDDDNFYSVKYVGELELGLRWETWFYDDNYHIAIQLGWEEQVWVNWGHFVEFVDEKWHDLNLHGLNLKFRFDF